MMPDALPAPIAVDIAINDEAWLRALPDAEAHVRAAVAAAFTEASLAARSDAELSIVLANDAMVRDLNRDYRGKDAPTNVLSFPAADASQTATAPHLGDIVLAFETVRREADDEAKAIDHHLVHLVAHGVLHLFGYDHDTDADAACMEAAERRILAALGIADPYADPAQ